MGIRVTTTYRGLPLTNAYMRVGKIRHGGKQVGWDAIIEVFAEQAATATGEPPLSEFNIYVGLWKAGEVVIGPAGTPEPTPPVAVPFNPLPYEALYAELKVMYPDAVDC